MRKFNFGLIGCGRISKNHFEAINAMPGVKLVGVCDTNESALVTCTKKYQCEGYSDYKQMLANPDIDIVSICTPSGLHASMAIDAMNAGKHVVVEKPMAMSLCEADAMIEASRINGVKLAVAHQNRFNNAIVKTRQALEAGKFGRLTHGSAVVRWHRDENYYKQAPWRGTWEHDGGCLMNQSIHNIDLLQWMFGPVESVFAYTATNLRHIQGEDVAVAVLRFRNGAFGTIEASTTIYPKNLEETLSLFGSTGTVLVGGVAVNKIEAWHFHDETDVEQRQFEEPPNIYGFGHADIIRDMIEAIKEGREPAITGTEGRKALEIILAIYHSSSLKKEITLPLQEKFRIGVGFSELHGTPLGLCR